MKAMKPSVAISIVLGLAAVTALIAWRGFIVIGEAVLSVGFGVFLVVGFHFVPIALAACAWRGLFQGDAPAGIWFFFLGRWVREGVNTLLPVAQV
ncbi:MAG: hypothetical protein QGF09_10175, partial [Rhodospirillales bacterium]|nr:hypothetical protein [Rhodospirillales bacterium]